MELLQEMKKVFTEPKALFARQAEEKNIKQGVMVCLAVCLISVLVQVVALPMNPATNVLMENGMMLVLVLLIGFPVSIIVSLLVLAIVAGIFHLLAKILGGQGEYKALLTCILFLQAAGLAGIPLSLINILAGGGGASAVIILSAGLGICLCIWMTYLLVLAVKICYQLSTAKALIVIFTPAIVFILLVIGVAFAVAA